MVLHWVHHGVVPSKYVITYKGPQNSSHGSNYRGDYYATIEGIDLPNYACENLASQLRLNQKDISYIHCNVDSKTSTSKLMIHYLLLKYDDDVVVNSETNSTGTS